MRIKKIKGSFNDYQVEMSFGQITAIKNALAADHSDPMSDELYAELTWYLDNIPGPGEEEEDLKREKEAAESGMASPEAAGQPLKPRADDLLPAAPEGGEGEMPPGGGEEGGMPGEEMGAEGPPGGEMPPGGGEEPGAGAPPQEEPSEADRRLPPPPTE